MIAPKKGTGSILNGKLEEFWVLKELLLGSI